MNLSETERIFHRIPADPRSELQRPCDLSTCPTLMMSATLRITVGSHEGVLALDTKHIRPIAQSSTPNCPAPSRLGRRGR